MYPEKNPVRTCETHGKKIRDQTSDRLSCKARAQTTSSSVPTCYCQTCCLLLAGRQKVLPRILCSARRSVLLCWFIEAEKKTRTQTHLDSHFFPKAFRLYFEFVPWNEKLLVLQQKSQKLHCVSSLIRAGRTNCTSLKRRDDVMANLLDTTGQKHKQSTHPTTWPTRRLLSELEQWKRTIIGSCDCWSESQSFYN